MNMDTNNTSTNNEAEDPILLREDNGGITTLTLYRPQQYNVLSRHMLTQLQQSLGDIANDHSIRVVIIAAAGKAFCAGHDLKEMRSSDDKTVHRHLFDQCSRLMLTINQMPQPVIAQVDGIATAAGCQLVAACDLAVASDASRFAVSGINVGLFCSTPSVALSRNLSRKQALQLLLTGEFIDAETALDYGLINQVTTVEALTDSTRNMAEKIVGKSPLAITVGKQLFYQQLTMELTDAYQYASEVMANNMDSEDAREGIDAFIEKRKPVWQGK